jgi:hypothetical protein
MGLAFLPEALSLLEPAPRLFLDGLQFLQARQ